MADLKNVDRKDIPRVLEIVHLTKDADRKVGQYSLGMKQRLGIAMALLGSPKLLILDEPTNGLDPAGIQEMRSLIASMPQTTGATVLISSHLLGEIEQMVDQVGILNHGRLLFEGSLQQLQSTAGAAFCCGCWMHPKPQRPAAAGSKSRCTGRPAGHPAAAPAARTKRWRRWSVPCRKRRGCGWTDCTDKEP